MLEADILKRQHIYDVPENLNHLEEVKNNVFKRENPQDTYKVIQRFASGSFGQIYAVIRKSDSKPFALKMMRPKNPKQFNSIKNEVGIMILCKDDPSIIKCIDAYDYSERLWVILEMMDVGALTDMLEDAKGDIDEKICAYILRKTLEGLDYLHSKSVIHRDIKSDNILCNRDGDIKLCDFGYATQLTKSKRGTVS